MKDPRDTNMVYRTALVYQQYGGGDPEDMGATIIDLTADIFHLADEYGIDPEDLVRTALMHYKAESRESGLI